MGGQILVIFVTKETKKINEITPTVALQVQTISQTIPHPDQDNNIDNDNESKPPSESAQVSDPTPGESKLKKRNVVEQNSSSRTGTEIRKK